MTKEQMVEIFKAGYEELPDLLSWDLNTFNYYFMSGVHRLHTGDNPFDNYCNYLTIDLRKDFIQIMPKNKLRFNHYAAIKKMAELKLI